MSGYEKIISLTYIVLKTYSALVCPVLVRYHSYNMVFHGLIQENGGSIVNIIADMFRGFPMMAHTGTVTLYRSRYTYTHCTFYIHLYVYVHCTYIYIYMYIVHTFICTRAVLV